MAFVLDVLRGPIGKGALIGAGGLALGGPIYAYGTANVEMLRDKPIYDWVGGGAYHPVIGLDYAVAVVAGCAVSSWVVNRFL
jgi:hypothetical protein